MNVTDTRINDVPGGRVDPGRPPGGPLPGAAPHGALRERLVAGRTCFTAWVGQGVSAGLILARVGFDAVTFDLQHGRIGLSDAVHGLTVLQGLGQPTIVRIPVGEFQTASRVLDAGASGIIAPMINTADEARNLLRFCKYPPDGERSWGPYGALAPSGMPSSAYLRSANRDGVVLAMIETREALRNLESILAVDGIDGVFVGPSDLSIALSAGERVDPEADEVTEALADVVTTAGELGKVAAVFSATGEAARLAAERGFALVAVGDDASLLTLGGSLELAEARRSAARLAGSE